MKVYLYDVFHRCDSITDWAPTDCVLALSSTEKVEGKYSIKMTITPPIARMEYGRGVNWSEFKSIIFSVYHPGWTDEVGRIALWNNIDNWSTWHFDFAAAWNEIEIDLSSPPDASNGTLDLSNIAKVLVYAENLVGDDNDFYFDFFRGRSLDVTPDISDVKITEEMGVPSDAELKIKGASLDHFQAGLEMEVYDSDDALSWRGRILYPKAVMEGTEVVGEIKALGSNTDFTQVYRKNFTTARDSDYVLKNIVDNALTKYHSYDDEIDDFTITYKYDLKTKIQKMFNYLSMLERAVIGHKPDGEMFFNKYNNLTASGKSWNQATSNVKITSYTPNANRHITRAPVVGANNDLGQVYYVGKASDAAVQKYALNYLQTWRDSEITNYTEAKQLGDNLLAIFSMDTQMISLLTAGKKHVQVGYTIEFAWTNVFPITQAHFLITKRVWYPMKDLCEIELTDNILTRKAFNVRVINKFYDEDAQQSYEEPDVSESTVDGTVIPLVSVAELRAGKLVSDAVYNVDWDGVGTIAPSKNAIYDITQAINNNVLKRPVQGTYTGDGNATQAITLGWRPCLILLMTQYGYYHWLRIDSDNYASDDHALLMGLGAGTFDVKIRITATGFEACGAGNGDPNLNGDVVDYVAWYSGVT